MFLAVWRYSETIFFVNKITCRIQKSDIPRAAWVGAPGGAAGRVRARLGANRIIRPGNESQLFPLSHRKMSLQRLSKSTNKRNAMYTDGGTKSTGDDRFIGGLSPGREARFVPGCRNVERRLFLSVNRVHARHVREHVREFNPKP